MPVDLRYIVAVPVTPSLVEPLVGAQRNLVSVTRGVCEVEEIPRAHLLLPLDDLGVAPAAAVEAFALAAEHVASTFRPFSVHLRGVKLTPTETGALAWAAVTDEHGHLTAIREALHQALGRYGFPLSAGAWIPQIPLARLTGAPILDADWAERPFGTLRVRSLVLLTPALGRRGLSFVPVHSQPLRQPFTGATTLQDDASERDALSAQLEARIGERMTQRRKPVRPRRTAQNPVQEQISGDPS